MRESEHVEFRVSRPCAFEALADVLATVAGIPATIDVGDSDGNPYDTYWRTVEIRATYASGEFFALWFTQNLSAAYEDPREVQQSFTVRLYLTEERFANRRAIWDALREKLAALGCTNGEPRVG